MPNVAQTCAFAVIVPPALAATFLALCPPVQAQPVSSDPAYGFSGRIGLGVVSKRSNEDSPNTRTQAASDPTRTYRTREWHSVEFGHSIEL